MVLHVHPILDVVLCFRVGLLKHFIIIVNHMLLQLSTCLADFRADSAAKSKCACSVKILSFWIDWHRPRICSAISSDCSNIVERVIAMRSLMASFRWN